MFPTFISIIDIQSWWEVPSIAHFCSLFRTAFNLLDFDIEDLEEALLTDGTEEPSWLQELIVKLLSGCLPNNEISTFNYQMFLRRLFRQKCQEHDQYNPFNTDVDFQLLPLRTKVDILHALCDFRLDAEDVLERLKNLEADSLRVEPLGYDNKESAYWYFYGTRLYREDFNAKNKKGNSVWQVVCFTEEDWFQLAKKFSTSTSKAEKQLYRTLSENFLPELPRLFQEKEKLARKRLLEKPRKSNRIQKLESVSVEEKSKKIKEEEEKEEERKRKLQLEKQKKLVKKRQEAYERRTRVKELSEGSQSEQSESRYEMAGAKVRNKKAAKTRQRKSSRSSSGSRDLGLDKKTSTSSGSTTVGRQTNNSLASATGQIVIQPVHNPHRKKLKTSQVFRQTEEDLQTGMHKILDHVKDHEDAWPFIDPVEEEYAPNYYSIIRKPMDLQKMEERLDAGHYRTFSKFRSDFQLIVDNCRLYNGAENEYTEMVDNLLKVFERATSRYLDQISSSDDEVAVEYPETESDSKQPTKSKKSDSAAPTVSKRKPTLAAQTDKKRERSLSDDFRSDSSVKSVKPVKSTNVVTKNSKKDTKKASKKVEKQKVLSKKNVKSKKNTAATKKSKKSKSSPALEEIPSRSLSKSPSVERWSSSPPPSWPPSSPDSRTDIFGQRRIPFSSDDDVPFKSKEKQHDKRSKNALVSPVPTADNKNYKKHKKDSQSFVIEHKDKHNKLRETIEKLKAKSEISSKLKSKNIDDPKIIEKRFNEKSKRKEKALFDADLEDGNSTVDSSSRSDNKTYHKKGPNSKTLTNKNVEMEALTLATEQTLKDINKWLDDTPRFSEFSSASNSPSHYISTEEFDRNEKKIPFPRKDPSKDPKRRPTQRDPTKFIKRREVQRTIDRLQPGKGKGNLLSNIQTSKSDELFPLGPISKIKESKNSLIVKTDDSAPKLSLGSVLDSFGKHKFIDDHKKEEEDKKESKTESKIDAPDNGIKEGRKEDSKNPKEEKKETEDKPTVKENKTSATPNLSAWFKAFGAPKTQPPAKKDSKEPKTSEDSPKTTPESIAKRDETKKVTPPPEQSPNPESPIATHGQPAVRQRKISTGSSMSERSSFSQDMDSPRVGIDERLGAYPAPYPSPLHRSPSGASPVLASPRSDLSPKAPSYPTFNGQIRVGFYQDTVSTKSSPDKACSPRDGPQSPYNQYQYPEHSTAAQMASYSYGNPPYYSQPNYSTTNPTPPYNAESGANSAAFYDTNKSLTDQYQAKVLPNYSGAESSPQPNVRSEDKAVFPVKKRAYNESEMGKYDVPPQTQEYNRNAEMALMMGRQPARGHEGNEKQSNIPPAHQSAAAKQEQDVLRTSYPAAANATAYNAPYNSESPYLNAARAAEMEQRKIDMSKYTNMGYTGADMSSFTRNSPQYTRSDLNYARSGTGSAHIEAPNANMAMRYANAAGATTSANQQPSHLTSLGHQPARSAADNRMTYGNPALDVDQSLGLRENLANLSHIVDRFSAEDRMLTSLQSSAASSYYANKANLAGSHMFSKAISTSSSGLPIFSQPNMALPYSHEMQATTSAMYERQMTELQNPAAAAAGASGNEKVAAQGQQEKKSKRRKSAKTAAPSSTAETASTTSNQGFQSYAGLKSNSAMEPGAISLKTASVVPGSAFNFGPTPTGLGLSSGLYGDKEGYSNFLEDFRSAPNYYMAAAAAAHHRTTPESSEKTVRTAHQSSAPQPPGYPFLGAPQARPPSYPLPTPFMPPHQAQLMDPSSPLYQQYMLHQGLLGPPGPYPPGYHPALSMRQPYESMTRPSWL